MNQPQYIGVLSTAPSPHRPWLGAVKLRMLKPLLGLLFIFAAAAMSLQSCPTLCNPIDGRPPGSPVLGFSRQEYWSGLPLPSPMHESQSEVGQSCLTLSDPMDCSLPGSSVQGFSRQEYWSGVPLPSPVFFPRRGLKDRVGHD